ncbi:MAG TPA: NUDIX domain-containing protein [Treponemataceae bacterium]|nr:NUDIX domain-containing protein [Treponemataceae bacterium]
MHYSVAGIFYEKGKVLIGKRVEKGDMAGRWEFPGGKVDSGERFEQALIREMFEEFGVTITVGCEIAKATFYHNDVERKLHAFCIKMPTNVSFTLTEHTEVKYASFDEILTIPFVDSDMLIFEQVRNACEK